MDLSFGDHTDQYSHSLQVKVNSMADMPKLKVKLNLNNAESIFDQNNININMNNK